MQSLLPKDTLLRTFDFTTAGDWDCVVAVERLPALHLSVDFIFLSFGIWVSLWNFETIRGSLMTSKWQKLASLAQEIYTLWFQFFGAVFASKGYPFKNIIMLNDELSKSMQMDKQTDLILLDFMNAFDKSK